ncbi:hypothetical protein [Kibdelosporangium philippinense]|uniref:hypothetical protein n=1 Tax=Kibdelosporangium philippinense TaxID=211113 RepID=UPI00361B37D3
MQVLAVDQTPEAVVRQAPPHDEVKQALRGKQTGAEGGVPQRPTGKRTSGGRGPLPVKGLPKVVDQPVIHEGPFWSLQNQRRLRAAPPGASVFTYSPP